MSGLVCIPFHGTNITVTTDQQVALRPTCDALGLDADSQAKRLKREPWACTAVMTVQMPDDTQRRDHLFMDRKTFTMWLATISVSRVKNEQARELLTAFQCEAADTLDRYFSEGAAINPRATEHQINAAIRQAQMQMELCQAAKGLIHPDHLEAQARIVLARGMNEAPQLPSGDQRILYTQDYLRGKNLSHDRIRSVAGVFGKRVKQAYIDRHGRPPRKYPMSVSNGQVREVNAYTEADRPLMDAVWAANFTSEVAS